MTPQDDPDDALEHQDGLPEYGVYVVRAYTKAGLAKKIQSAIQAQQPEDIININVHADQILAPFWARNSAIITLRLA